MKYECMYKAVCGINYLTIQAMRIITYRSAQYKNQKSNKHVCIHVHKVKKKREKIVSAIQFPPPPPPPPHPVYPVVHLAGLFSQNPFNVALAICTNPLI